MKKLTLIFAIVLGLGLGAVAQQNGGGLFQRGYVSDEQYYGAGYFNDRTNSPMMPVLPGHNSNDNQDASPLGSGIALLLGLGGAYLVAKKRREE